MVVLKEFELSVYIESISFQRKVQHVYLWLAITKSYLKNDNFEVYAKKVNRELCTQFRAKRKPNSQVYIVNFFSSGKVVINAKDFRKKLLEIHIPKLEELYGITFDVKGATQLIQTTSEANLTTQTTISNQLTTFEMGKILRTRITSKVILLILKLQAITNTMNNKQRISFFRTTHAIRTMTTKQQQKTQTTGFTKYQQI